MIEFNPSLPKIWLIIFLMMILLILGFQLFSIFKSADQSPKKWVKSILNILFSVFLICYLLQPVWESDQGSDLVLVYSKDVSTSQIKGLRDSLGIRKTLSIEDYQGKGNPVYLVGNRYSEMELNRLNGKNVHLVKGEEGLFPEYLHWKGIVRKGEMQQVTGLLSTGKKSLLELKIQDQVLASDSIEAIQGSFNLRFPVQVTGRNEVNLFLNDSLIAGINFFAVPPIPKTFQLRFSFPNPEQRNLNRYLEEKGEKVDERIQVSRASQIQSIDEDLDSLKVMIADLNQLKSRSVRAELSNGVTGVLMINSGNPESDIREMNELFKTDFEIKRSGTEEWRELESGIEALPYTFEAKKGQKMLFENSVAVQDLGTMKVGMSFISQTFPIYLSGDTAVYSKIWDEILGDLIPDQLNNWSYDAPLFSDQIGTLIYNGAENENGFSLIGSDTIYFQQDLVNPFTQVTRFSKAESGWVSLSDSMEVYLYGVQELETVRNSKNVADFLRGNNANEAMEKLNSEKGKISDWVWLGLFLLFSGLMWLEPRLNY